MVERPKTILIQKKGEQESVDSELSGLCKMMRIMSERDTDATLAQVLKTMMLHSQGKPVGGSELSEISGINRITIIHHLKRLEGAGFVRRSEGKYLLRVRSAEDMLVEFRKEMEDSFRQMDEMAREIDAHFSQMEKEMLEFHKRRRLR